MKFILYIVFACSLFCHAEEKLPVDFPLELPDSELNREYVKNNRQVVSYKTKLRYAEACDALTRLLGEGWKKREPGAEEAEVKKKLLTDPVKPFVGLDTYINDQYPELTITIAQVHSSVQGNEYPYFVTLTIGPIPE